MSHLSTRRKALLFVLLGILFSVAYTQSPLYTSNQNQYMLHGMARAGVGFLDQDWLANTLDPTPLFSALIYFTIRFLHSPFLFYVYYAVLLGLYLYLLVEIAVEVFPALRSTGRFWLLIAVLFVLHSAAWRYSLSRLIGVDWAYLFEDGLADQRLLGPVFQPSSFGVLLLLSIFLFLRRKPLAAVLAAVLAASIHPTYLLSAAALTVTYMWQTYREASDTTLGRKFRQPALIGGMALLFALPILIYVYAGFGNASPALTAKAQEILVNFRIPFHALPARWFDLRAVIKLALILAGVWTARKTRLFNLLLIPLLVAAFLTIVQVVTHNNSLALIFPWRISTLLFPLAMTSLIAKAISALPERQKTMQVISVVLILLVVVIGVIRLKLDFQRQATSPDRPIMAYVAAHHASGQYYMIPLDMQDFRLATSSPVYVEFKSIPYRDQDVLEWYERIQTADLYYKKGDCSWNEKFANMGITHIIATGKLLTRKCKDWQELYRDEYYGLFEIK
jgi:hypothetical protein